MEKINLIVFDLDGTILNTIEDIRSAINYVLSCYDIENATTDDVKRYVGNGFSNALRAALDDKCQNYVDENEFSLMLTLLRTRYKNHATENTVKYQGMEELLGDLNKKEIPIGVLTNKDDEVAKALIDKFYRGIKFSFVEGKKASRALKTDKHMVSSLLSSYGFNTESTLFVGDSEVDRTTASNVGSPSLIVNYGFRSKEILEMHGIYDSIDSVESLRCKIFKMIS